MKKRIVRVVVLVTLICLFSVYGRIEPRMPTETIVLAKNVIIKGPFMTPKMYKKPDLKMKLDYDWTNEVPYKEDFPYKYEDKITTYHDLEAYLKQLEEYTWPLEWPSSDNGVEFLPLGRIKDRNQMFIPIEPLEAKYKFLRDCFTKGSQ